MGETQWFKGRNQKIAKPGGETVQGSKRKGVGEKKKGHLPINTLGDWKKWGSNKDERLMTRFMTLTEVKWMENPVACQVIIGSFGGTRDHRYNGSKGWEGWSKFFNTRKIVIR